jgi:phospholipid transport system transporter-binding protein
MKKRKQASSSAAHRARDGHIPSRGKAAGKPRVSPAKPRVSPPKPRVSPAKSRVSPAKSRVSEATPRVCPPKPPVREPASPALILPAECSVSGARSLKDQLAALLDEPSPVTLDVSSLRRVDTAALQVIAAFIRERTGRGRCVQWQGSAAVLTTAAQLLGLNSVLQLPS